MIELIIVCVTGVLALWIALSFKFGEKKAERKEEQRLRCEEGNHHYKWLESDSYRHKATGNPVVEGTCKHCGFMTLRRIVVER